MTITNPAFKAIKALTSAKFKYHKIKKSDYLVLDEVNSQWIVPLLPKDKSYYILECRGLSLQIRLMIILRFVKHTFLKKSKAGLRSNET